MCALRIPVTLANSGVFGNSWPAFPQVLLCVLRGRIRCAVHPQLPPDLGQGHAISSSCIRACTGIWLNRWGTMSMGSEVSPCSHQVHVVVNMEGQGLATVLDGCMRWTL